MQTPSKLEPDRQQHENLRRMLLPRSSLPKPALSFPQRTIRRAFQVSLFQFIFKLFLKGSVSVQLRKSESVCTVQSTVYIATTKTPLPEPEAATADDVEAVTLDRPGQVQY
jgi:hypothetical protein